MGIVQGREAGAAVGEKTIDGSAGNIQISSRISDIGTLRKLPLTADTVLGDVATVELEKQQETISRVNGEDVLILTITKAGNANAVAVGEAVAETVGQVNKEVKGASAKVMLSTSEQVTNAVHSMLKEVLMGALFATIVILLFMRNVRATLITIISIPLSLALTLYLLDLSGVTLNIITLGGVAVAVGRLVDDSIVVIENIYRRLQKESFSTSLIIDSTKEVASAITSSTLVTVAVFLPMGLLRGTLQSFLLPFALTVAYSLLASLLVALTVVPLLSAVLLRGTRLAEHQGAPRFSRFLKWNLQHKWVPLLVSGVLFFGAIGAYMFMPKAALDSSSASNVNISLEYENNKPREDVIAAGKQLEQWLLERTDIDWLLMQNGNSADSAKYGNVSSPTQVSYMIGMKEGADAELLIEAVKAQKEHYKGAELTASAADLMMGGGAAEITVDVTGDSPEAIAAGAEQAAAAIEKISDVLKVTTNQEQKKPVYTFELDPMKAKGEEVARQLQGLLNPLPLGSITLNNAETMVMLQPAFDPRTADDLKALTVMTEQGPVRLDQIAKLKQSEEASLFYHKDGKLYIRITATVEPSRLSVAGKEIADKINELKPAGGVAYTVGGASAEQAGDFADLGLTALISIGIVYLIMVIAFKTIRAPLAIMFSLPLAAIGAIGGLIVSGISPDFTAMFGALMLIGVVVTNAIVLIDRVKQNEQHMPIRDAVIEAAATRMRPILMTAVATICAMLPLLFGTAENGSIVSQSLAIVVVGGLAAATILTLVIVPCMYELLFFRKSKKQRQAAAAAIMAEV